MTKLKHGPNRRTPLDRRPVRHRDQPPQVDLVDVLGLPPLRAEEPPVPRLRAQLVDAALEAARSLTQSLQQRIRRFQPRPFGRRRERAPRVRGLFAKPRTSVPRSPALGDYHQAPRERPPAAPMKKLITKSSAAMTATMKSQWTVKPTPNRMIARIASRMRRSMFQTSFLLGAQREKFPLGCAFNQQDDFERSFLARNRAAARV